MIILLQVYLVLEAVCLNRYFFVPVSDEILELEEKDLGILR